MEPVYRDTLHSGELDRKARAALSLLRTCTLCPRRCGADRTSGETGACHTGLYPVISASGPHFGEEAPLTGMRGSGTIFFAFCNLRCVYCQNYEISHEGRGTPLSCSSLAEMMLDLQERGCHNINLVSPSHVVPQVIAALREAAMGGLHIPIVYNTGGFDSVETLGLLDGIVDIYMPDIKYSDEQIGRDLSGIAGYPDVAKAAVREMHRQVGDLVLHGGIAERGLLVRHLVLPGGLSGAEEILEFLARVVSPATWVNIMDQYHPVRSPGLDKLVARDPRYAALKRRITGQEYEYTIRYAGEVGLHRGFPAHGG